MLFFRLFSFLLMSISWSGIEVEVPVFDSINRYLNIPQAVLVSDGAVINDPDMYYVINAVDNTFISDINTNYIGTVRHKIKVVFPNYHMESKQEIIFNIVDKIKPEIIYAPEFYISLNQAVPDLKLGLEYHDNYWDISDITVKILGTELINNKKVGKYPITYQLIDKSLNVATANSFVYVIDSTPPEIIKAKDILLEIGEAFQVSSFFKITDNHDQYVNVEIDTSKVNFNKIGSYPITIIAADQSGNEAIKNDFISIIHTKPPEIELYSLSKIGVFSNNYYEFLVANIKRVYDKVDNLVKSDVIIEEDIDINVLGIYEVKYKLANSQGNIVTKEIKVAIVDETKPSIKIINDLEIEVYCADLIFTNYFDISDNYTPYSELTIKYVHSIKKDIIGTYGLRVEVSDKQKNIEILETEFKVVDKTAPIFINFPESIEIEVFKSLELTNYQIEDNYDKKPSFEPKILYFNEVGIVEHIITAVDSSGNKNYHTIMVNVVDTEAPYLFLSTNEIKISINSLKINPLDYIVDFYDNYDILDIENIIIIEDVNYDKIGLYEIIYCVTDNSGNEEVKIINVIIDDTTAPIITTHNQRIKKGTQFDIWDGVNIKDDDNELELYSNPSYINTNITGTYLITYTVVDSRGNIATTKREVVIYDSKDKYLLPIIISANLLVTSLAATIIYIIFKKKHFL